MSRPVDEEPHEQRTLGPASMEDEDLHWFLERLHHNARILRRIGSLVVSLTLLNIVLTVVAFFVGGYNPDPDEYVVVSRNEAAAWFLAPYSTIVLVCVLLLWRFESRRRYADAVFDEFSDALQRNLAGSVTPGPQGHFDQLLRAEERVLLREYRLVRVMPFASGEQGPIAYVLFNVALLIVSLLGVFAFR